MGMRAVDLWELYTYLKLFGRVYTDCEAERQTMEKGVEEILNREYSREKAAALQVMRNPRNAGRRRKNGLEAQEQVRALSAQGKTIRDISAETGIPKSTVQRLKRMSDGQVSHN